MVRAPSIDKNGMKKGAWSEEEDSKLRAYILRYEHWNWRQLPKFAGVARCGKSCKLRWMNYLKPNVKRGSYTKEEEDLILKLHSDLGNKWSAIAAKLPGRIDNDIKNYWHTKLKTRAKQYSTLECGATPESDGEQNDQISSKTSLSYQNDARKTMTGIYSPLPTGDCSEPSPYTPLPTGDCFEPFPEYFYDVNEDFWADFTNEFLCPFGNDLYSSPSPVMVHDLWSYDLHSYE